MEFFIYSLDRNGYLREESIDEVTNIFRGIYERTNKRIYYLYAADGTYWSVCEKFAGMYGSSVARIRF